MVSIPGTVSPCFCRPWLERQIDLIAPEVICTLGRHALSALAGEPLTVFGDGSQTRSFCYIDDLVRGISHVLLDPTLDGEVFNIGNPHEITVRELAEHIKELLAGAIVWVTWPTVIKDLLVFVAVGLFHYRFRRRFRRIWKTAC